MIEAKLPDQQPYIISYGQCLQHVQALTVNSSSQRCNCCMKPHSKHPIFIHQNQIIRKAMKEQQQQQNKSIKSEQTNLQFPKINILFALSSLKHLGYGVPLHFLLLIFQLLLGIILIIFGIASTVLNIVAQSSYNIKNNEIWLQTSILSVINNNTYFLVQTSITTLLTILFATFGIIFSCIYKNSIKNQRNESHNFYLNDLEEERATKYKKQHKYLFEIEKYAILIKHKQRNQIDKFHLNRLIRDWWQQEGQIYRALMKKIQVALYSPSSLKIKKQVQPNLLEISSPISQIIYLYNEKYVKNLKKQHNKQLKLIHDDIGNLQEIHLIDKISQVNKIKQLFREENIPHTNRAVIIFKHPLIKQLFIDRVNSFKQKASSSQNKKKVTNLQTILKQFEEKFTLVQAPLPNQLHPSNFHYQNKLIYRFVLFGVCLFFIILATAINIVASFLTKNYLTFIYHSILKGLLLSFEIFIGKVLIQIVSNFEYWSIQNKKITWVIKKQSLFLWVLAGPLLISSLIPFEQKNILQEFINNSIWMVIFLVLLNWINLFLNSSILGYIWNFIQFSYASKNLIPTSANDYVFYHKLTQKQTNKLIEKPQYNYWNRIGQTLLIFFISGTLSPFIPIVSILLLADIMLRNLYERIIFIHFSSQPRRLSEQIPSNSLKLLNLTPLMISLSNLSLSLFYLIKYEKSQIIPLIVINCIIIAIGLIAYILVIFDAYLPQYCQKQQNYFSESKDYPIYHEKLQGTLLYQDVKDYFPITFNILESVKNIRKQMDLTPIQRNFMLSRRNKEDQQLKIIKNSLAVKQQLNTLSRSLTQTLKEKLLNQGPSIYSGLTQYHDELDDISFCYEQKVFLQKQKQKTPKATVPPIFRPQPRILGNYTSKQPDRPQQQLMSLGRIFGRQQQQDQILKNKFKNKIKASIQKIN